MRKLTAQLAPTALLTNAVDFEDRARAIPDVHHAFRVKRDTARHAQIARKRNCLFERSDLVDHALQATRDEHLSVLAEGDPRWIRNVSRVLADFAVEVDTEERDW